MMAKKLEVENWEYHPLTPARWADFEQLFGANGACAGCWCAWFLMTNQEFKEAGKEGHKQLMYALVQAGAEPGIIAYADGVPAGWLALAPREKYKRLTASKVLAPIDDQAAWVIPCFFIHRKYRRQGMMDRLLVAAIEYVKQKGAQLIEAYPIEAEEKVSAVNLFSGVATVFRRQGFELAEKRGERLIFRKSW